MKQSRGKNGILEHLLLGLLPPGLIRGRNDGGDFRYAPPASVCSQAVPQPLASSRTRKI